MPDLELTRVNKPRQTLGILSVVQPDKGVGQWVRWKCATLELPWQANENRRSCIPPAPGESAEFDWKRHESPRYGECLWVPGVPGRSEILIHAGNFVSDTLGCILVGESFADISGDGVTDVTRSQKTLQELLSYLEAEGTLRISWTEEPQPAPLEELDAPSQEPTLGVS